MTNGILPARLRIHMRSSTARATAISRYISTRSSRDRPRSAPSSLSALGAALVVMGSESLEVDRLAVDGEGGLAQCLRQGGVRVDGRPDLPRGRLEQHGHTGLADEVGHPGADHVHAQQLVRPGIGDDLDEALVLAANERLADGLERHLADLDGNSRGVAFLLRTADR